MVSQVILFRELAVVFLGQEIALGVALSAWLLWTGAGAIHSVGSSDAGRVLSARLGAAACVLPLSALLIRCSRLLIPAGHLPGLLATVLLPFVLLAAPCWLLGAVFAAGARLAAERWGPAGPARIYLWASIGGFTGGRLSALFFRLGYSSFPVLAAGGLLLALLTFEFPFGSSRRGTAIFLVITLLITGFSRALDHASRRIEWRSYDLVAERETPYEHAALARLGGLHVLFENGAVSAQFPDPAVQEELVHWPLLAHPAPRRVLALGIPAATALAEILKHPVDSVDLVTPDPAALELIEPLRDPRIHQSTSDPRLWIKRHPDTYDVILQTLPEPQNAASNRLFTAQFFEEARRALHPGGVLAFTLASSENYLSPEIAYTDASILQTAKQAFPSLEEIPGSRLIVLASDRPISLDPSLLAGRYHRRHIINQALVPELFPWALHPERRNALRLRLQNVRHVKINSDLWPVSLSQIWRIWLAKLVGPSEVLSLVAAFFAASVLVRRLWRRQAIQFRIPESTVLLGIGFAGISLEIVLLYMFQAASGSLYWQLGILFAAFMAGLAAGSAPLARNTCPRSAAFLSTVAAALAALCAVLAWVAPQLITLARPLGAFIGLLVLTGALVGAAFPLALARAPGRAGALYAADLWGSALGALLSGLILVPVFGHQRTLIFSACALILSLGSYLTSPVRQTPRS